ncbi:hypothetical protein M1D30_06800 [Prevotella sp. E15-22]|nr:hypothetical protein [Prevotella sp. E15-22]UPS43318.1 hypothetical protein M1D30_06800 [Prevotella sp. E15-22]
MKKQYITPNIQVVKLQHRTKLLAGSPGDQKSLDLPSGGDPIDDEKEVW